MRKNEILGGYILEDDDYKEISKLVWDDDKNGIIEYAEKEMGEEINKEITFEEFYKTYDNCFFQEYDDKENWNYWEEHYAKNICNL